ncbi:hypothetical protein ACFO6V_24445 [Promicromonospora alba]|uniref:MYXO-CTERM domain-containing protein n=1 Tax=Promicromonospora alba TaxID=1616110 RepID=A0ABV9HPA6_9MICO
MRVISLLRSTVAGPRRRPVGVLAILTVIVGVVTMHSMSGSPITHSHAVPHEAPVVVAEQVTAAAAVVATTAVVRAVAEAPDGHGEQGAGDCEGCCGDGLVTAMCLMVLVALLALVAPARRLLWRAPLELAMALTPALVGVRAVAAPSLHELCISRT